MRRLAELFVIFSLFCIVFVVGHTPKAAAQESNPQTQISCSYFSGVRAGQVDTFMTNPNFPSVPAGASCTDRKGNYGVSVTSTGNNVPQPMALTCEYISGPRAGITQSFIGVPHIKPLAVGSDCHDGLGDTGVVVADAYTRRGVTDSEQTAYTGPFNGDISNVVLNAR